MCMTLAHDLAGRNVYPVVAVNLPLRDAIEVLPAVFDLLAAKYNAPHYVVSDFERTDSYGISQRVKGWNMHFTHLPHGELVVAYEKVENVEPCAAVLGKQPGGVEA